MKAIILAAGIGKRLWPLTADHPKCLLQFGGETLLQRMLTALEHAGVQDVVIVVGYQRQMIRDAVSQRTATLSVRWIENPRYQKGSLLSLWWARKELNTDVLILDADVLCPPTLLARLVDSPHANAFLLDPRTEAAGEEMMLSACNGKVLNISRQVQGTWDMVGESVGFCKLAKAASLRLRQSVEMCLRQGKIHADYEHAFLPVLVEFDVGYELVQDVPWLEIDTPADVERAKREILPQLMRENCG